MIPGWVKPRILLERTLESKGYVFDWTVVEKKRIGYVKKDHPLLFIFKIGEAYILEMS